MRVCFKTDAIELMEMQRSWWAGEEGVMGWERHSCDYRFHFRQDRLGNGILDIALPRRGRFGRAPV